MGKTNESTVTKMNLKTKTLFHGMKSAQDTDDWTLYRAQDFEQLNKTQGGFLGYLVGYKFTSKKRIPMFYFVTEDGEMLKAFGNGNLTTQIASIIEQGGIGHQVGILYEGKETVDLGGELGEKEINQWRVYFAKETKGSTKLLNLANEIDNLLTDAETINTFVQDLRNARNQ